MIKTTRRYLDTCDCIIEYSFDSELPIEEITHFNPRTVNKCPAHEHLANDQGHFDAITQEDLARLEAQEP